MLECTWGDNSISVLCNFENNLEFDERSTYILELLSAKKPHLKPYKISEAKFSKGGVSFSGDVSHKTLSGYGYIPLDIDTFVITERKLSDTDFKPFIKAFTGLVWNVDAKYEVYVCGAVEVAKEKLESMKSHGASAEFKRVKEEYLDKINTILKNYRNEKYMPMPYKWFFVDGGQPICDLSSLKHALFNPGVNESVYQNGGYYMGIYENHLAVACKIFDTDMPFYTLNDVAKIIYDGQNGHKYCAVGISLENDGQYFEKILAIGTK